MATPQARREALGPLGTRILQSIPKIAFVSTIVISTLTPPQSLIWMVSVFFYGESGAHMDDGAPPLPEFIDGHGRTSSERFTDSKWSTLLHVLPGKQSFVVVPRGIETDPHLALSWLLLWPSQFTSKFRWKSPWFHRFLGTALMIDAALILSGVLAMCANGAC
jgi:hypothetical protein